MYSRLNECCSYISIGFSFVLLGDDKASFESYLSGFSPNMFLYVTTPVKQFNSIVGHMDWLII